MDNELTDYKNIDEFDNPYTIKCVLLGSHGVGKTTLSGVLSDGIFDPNIQSTIGMGFASKKISLINYNNHQIKLQIWDTAGQEKYHSIVRQYLRGVSLAFIVFDLTDRQSWNNLNIWKKDLEKESSYGDIPIIILVGTKSDLPNRAINFDEIAQKAKEWGCRYYVISSIQQSSVSMINRMFLIEVEDFHRKIIQRHILGQPVPPGIYKDTRRFKIAPLHNNNSWCCFQ